MKIAILTPSFNKSKYVCDAIQSVLQQTYKDFVYYILENSTDNETKNTIKTYVESANDRRIVYIDEYFTEEERKADYPTAILLNKYFDLIKTDVIIYLSDDDILATTCFERVVEYFKSNPSSLVCYYAMHSIDMKGNDHGTIFAHDIKVQGSNLDCMLDSGQIAFRTEILDLVEKPYYTTNWAAASHCDGLFLTNLCKVANFDPINEVLLTHRRTEQSAFTVG